MSKDKEPKYGAWHFFIDSVFPFWGFLTHCKEVDEYKEKKQNTKVFKNYKDRYKRAAELLKKYEQEETE